MIADSKKKELQLFYFALKKTIKVADAANVMGISIRALREGINNVNDVVNREFLHEEVIQVSCHNELIINPQSEEDGLLLFYKLKFFYLQQNHEFKLLWLLFTRNCLTAKQLCDELYISKSYLLRTIKKMNLYFTKYLSIEIQSSPQGFLFIGNEAVIRLLSFLILSDTYHAAMDWPYPFMKKESLELLLTGEGQLFSAIQKNLLTHLLSITLSRKNHPLLLANAQSKEIRQLCQALARNYDVTKRFNHEFLSIFPPETQEDEQLFFNFICRIFISDIVPVTKKVEMGQLLQTEPNLFSQLAMSLIQQLQETISFTLTVNDTQYLIYFLTLGLAFHHVLNEKAHYLHEFIYEVPNFEIPITNDTHKSVEQLLTTFSKKNHISFLERDTIKATFADLLTMVIQLKSEKPLFICIQTSRDFYIKKILADLILKTFNNDIIKFTDDITEANLVITNTLPSATKNKKYYFLDSIQNQAQWTGLLQLIQTQLLNTLFSVPSLELENLLIHNQTRIF